MTVFESRNYREALEKIFTARKELQGSEWSMARLAAEARIQPSYLTNVTKKRAHLSADQLFAIGEKLKLRAEETEYLQLLMEWERAAHEGRKEQLAAQLAKVRDRRLRAERYLSAPAPTLSKEDQERYYLDPNIELLHMYLTTKSCPRDLRKVAEAWRFSETYVAEILGLLERLKLIERKGKWWASKNVHQHLPRESPLCRPQQVLKKMRALDTIQRIPENRAYSFLATVTMTDETRVEIQARFLDFLRECEELVKKSPPEKLFQLQFDLFPWTE